LFGLGLLFETDETLRMFCLPQLFGLGATVLGAAFLFVVVAAMAWLYRADLLPSGGVPGETPAASAD
jgi:hypothetical protein